MITGGLAQRIRAKNVRKRGNSLYFPWVSEKSLARDWFADDCTLRHINNLAHTADGAGIRCQAGLQTFCKPSCEKSLGWPSTLDSLPAGYTGRRPPSSVVEHLHGKEGIDGSRPSEGSASG